MKYIFKLRPEDKDAESDEFMRDYDSMYEIIEDDVEMGTTYGIFVHDEITIEVEIEKEEHLNRFLTTLAHFEWPSPKCEEEPYIERDEQTFYPVFTVTEIKGNKAKVDLKFHRYLGTYDTKVVFELEGN